MTKKMLYINKKAIPLFTILSFKKKLRAQRQSNGVKA